MDWWNVGRSADVTGHGESPMTDSYARTTILVCRWVSSLCFVTACTAVSAQESVNATPNQAELDRARQLIRETPCPGAQLNPVRVIRSVNCLHSLGKKQAISLLLEVASPPDMGPQVGGPDDMTEPASSPHDQRVCTIIPLLFDVPENGTPPPEAWYCTKSKRWQGAAGDQVVQGDIPFAIFGEWTYGGKVMPTRPLVEWAAKHGKLRAEKLVPQDDPLEAADALHRRISTGTVIEFEQSWAHVDEAARAGIIEGLHRDLRAQAIRMLHNGMRDLKDLPWDQLRNKVGERGIHWDSRIEAHMLSGNRNIR
jgi:hypothetical protein